MEKEFIPYEQALALKELGFDEKCCASYYKKYDNEIGYHKVHRDFNFAALTVSAPLYQQAFRWFREKYNLHSYIEGAYPWFRYYVNSEDDRWEGFKHTLPKEAELECLKKLIEIVKEK